ARARGGDEPHAAVGVVLCDLAGAVRRAVGSDEDLQPVAGIVERERVLEPLREDAFLVVGDDDQRNARDVAVVTARAVAAHVGAHGGSERIANVRPENQPERAPENDPEDFHSLLEGTRSRRAKTSGAASASTRNAKK